VHAGSIQSEQFVVYEVGLQTPKQQK